MKSEKQLQDDVLTELRWEPSVDAAAIGVAAKDGAVTLTGHVGSYAQRMSAVKAAERIYGVTAVADELEVRLTGDSQRDDADIARAIANALDWNTNVPTSVKAEVNDGWVTLTGEVDWSYQRDDAASSIRYLLGVKGVTNLITVKPKVTATEVKDKISEAFSRNADLDARRISIDAFDGTVELRGHVHSLHEDDVARSAAWSAPGVREVKDHLTITP
jgi:osmotically-inducible protein OsmY